MNHPALDRAVEALRPQLEETLAAWIRIPSVKGDPQPGAPFGTDVRRMLDRALQDGNALLGNARDIDGYACDMEIGEGRTSSASSRTWTSCPPGDGWQVDPFGATVKDGKMYGRGTSDDKGPAVAALYAMKAVKDAGIALNKRVRLILGCDEESGMDDIAYYDEKVGLPPSASRPTRSSPSSIPKKAFCRWKRAPRCAARRSSPSRLARAPTSCLARPSRSSAAQTPADKALAFAAQHGIRLSCETLEGDTYRLTVTGVPAHASTPWQGVNAASQLLLVLEAIGAGGKRIKALADAIGHDSDGTGLGIAGSDKVSGPLTINLGLLSYDGETLSATFDCRYPVFYSDAQIVRFVELRLSEGSFTIDAGHASQPHHVPESSFIVRSLLKVYGELSGHDAHTVAIGGGTYARCMKQAVAFGPLFPGEEELAHQAGENVDLAQLMLSVRIFAYAIVELAGA